MSPSSTITAAQRSAALSKARRVRDEMAQVRVRISIGDLGLAEALIDYEATNAVNSLYVVKLLESLPGVGKVRARQVMSEVGILPKRRVLDLDAQQRAALIKVLAR